MTLSDAEKNVLNAAVEVIQKALTADGDKITVRGFGTFKRKAVAARTARNPKTGAPVAVPARSVLKFSAAAAQKIAK